MIRYPKALNEIDEAMDAEAPGWLSRARERIQLFELLGRYVEEYKDEHGNSVKLPPFWGEVKQVYMRRQHSKCIYCESSLEGGATGRIQWDLEHFRPKGSIAKWPGNDSAIRYEFDTGSASKSGYYLLAYHPRNYAAACKTCNSPFKHIYFPIAGARVQHGRNPEDYDSEQPFLVYPLGDGDDPEDLITFFGAEAFPRYRPDEDQYKSRRGQVIIDLFGLNREPLVRNRAWWLRYCVWNIYTKAAAGDVLGMEDLELILSNRSSFVSCARRFVDLCRTDRAAAEAMLPALKRIVEIFDGEPSYR